MNIKLKRCLLTVLSALMVFSIFIAFMGTAGKVNATTIDVLGLEDYVSTFVMKDGASVRVSTENSGLRFGAKISKTEYDALKNVYGCSEEDITMGMLIAPKDILNGRELSLASGLTEDVDYVNIKRQIWAAESDSNTYVFNAVLSNLQQNNFDRTFVARAYINIGNETVYAGEFDEAGRNAVYVANAVKYEDGLTGQAIDNYLNKVNGYVDADLTVASSMEIYVGQNLEVSATYSGTVNQTTRTIAVYPVLSTEDSTVRVSKNSLTGVSAGTAIVKAAFNGIEKTINVTVKDAKVLANGTYLSYEDNGADFTVNVPEGEKVRVLQLSDTQIIDVTTEAASRLADAEKAKWEDLDANLFNYMDKVVSETNPHFIVLAGDNVYGEFDTNFNMLNALIEKLDSYGIYWSFVFGNHDREVDITSIMNCYANSEYCLYNSNVSFGDSNYSIVLKQGNEYLRVLYMLDTNSTYNRVNDVVIANPGITSTQLNWFSRTASKIENTIGEVPASVYMHIRSAQFYDAALTYGYVQGETLEITEGNAVNGDFGCIHSSISEKEWLTNNDNRFFSLIKNAGVDSINIGHNHKINSSILYDGVRLTFGLKTGTFDDYQKGELGGTLMTLNGKAFDVEHVYAVNHEVEEFEYLVSISYRSMYGSLFNAYSNEEITLSSTTDVDEVPANGSGKALKANRVYGGDGTASVYNFVEIQTGMSLSAGESYKMTFDFRTSDTSNVFYAQPFGNGSMVTTNSPSFKNKNGTNVIYFTPNIDVNSLNVRIGNGATMNDYWMTIDNFTIEQAEVPVAENFEDAFVSGKEIVGYNMIVNNYSVNMSVELTTDATELPDNADKTALKFVNDGSSKTFNYVSFVTNTALTMGKSYFIEFDYKILSGTYNGNLLLYGNSNKHIETFSGLNKGGHATLHYIAEEKVDNLVIYFADGETSEVYSVSVDNILITEADGYTEDYELTAIKNNSTYGSKNNTVYGGIQTVFAETSAVGASWAMATNKFIISEDESLRPTNSTGKFLTLDVQYTSSGHNYTWVQFNFGSVDAGSTYNIKLNSKLNVVAGSTGTPVYKLSTSTEPRSANNLLSSVPEFKWGDFSLTHTFTESYDNVCLWVQLTCNNVGDHVVLAFDNVSITKV